MARDPLPVNWDLLACKAEGVGEGGCGGRNVNIVVEMVGGDGWGVCGVFHIVGCAFDEVGG